MMHLISVVTSAVMAVASSSLEAPAPSTVRDLHRLLTAPHRHVRTHDERIRAAFFDGVRRSRTFGDLVAALERSDVIVYVEPAHFLPAQTDGGLSRLSTTGGYRYLRILVRPTFSRDQLISLIGHELQHAVEIAEAPGVYDENSMRKLYARLGVGVSDMHGFETEAARDAGYQVRRELRRFS
jgi:hypothetical protein